MGSGLGARGGAGGPVSTLVGTLRRRRGWKAAREGGESSLATRCIIPARWVPHPRVNRSTVLNAAGAGSVFLGATASGSSRLGAALLGASCQGYK